MVLYQLIERKRGIDREICELKICLYNTISEDKIKELFLLFNKRKDYLLLIYKLNEENSINVNGDMISLANAVCVCKVLESKIKFITDLIDKQKQLFFVLNEQRKSITSEYELLKVLILKKDLEIEV